MERKVYADNAATTCVSSEVLEAMLPCYREIYGNPSSLYTTGQEAKKVLESARESIAASIGAKPSEIFFTSCGTESDNWAIKGTAHMMARQGKNHIITSSFEHHAVLHSCAALEKEGFQVTYLDVHENGIIRPAELESAITEKTALVTIMYANNEIGTIQPIDEIAAICKKHNVIFHTDAVQAVGHVPIDVHAQGIDMLSMSGHKFHAPKGVGALYVRNGINLLPFIDGGAQERGKRGGTENVAGITGMAKALEIAVKNMDSNNKKLREMQTKLIDEILKIDRSRLNGDRIKRLPGNISFCFQGVEGESLLLMLDLKGVSASSGSACTSGSLDPSHVLLSIGLPAEIAHGSLRLSFSDVNSMEDIDYIIKILPPIVERLRSMSPLWDEIKQGKRKIFDEFAEKDALASKGKG
jgi:cysteine desulfurase